MLLMISIIIEGSRIYIIIFIFLYAIYDTNLAFVIH